MALAAVIIGIARKTAIDNGKRTLSTKRTDLGKSSGEQLEWNGADTKVRTTWAKIDKDSDDGDDNDNDNGNDNNNDNENDEILLLFFGSPELHVNACV